MQKEENQEIEMMTSTAAAIDLTISNSSSSPTNQRDEQQHENHDNDIDGHYNKYYPSPYLVSQHEEMNPSRRCSMEDCAVYHPPGTWDSPDDEIAYLGVYDGHGGKLFRF